MSISALASRHGLNGQTLRKQYRERISGYKDWGQMGQAEEYVLFPENLGEDMSLDETCLSNGDVYTILTNKAAHGGQCVLAAMVRSLATDTVVGVQRRIPPDIRQRIRTVTTDLSSAMMLTVRKAFPRGTLVYDRFHLRQLMPEASKRHRWEAIEAENKAIKEHRERRRTARTREEREEVGLCDPERFPVLATARPPSIKLADIFNRKSTAAPVRLSLTRLYSEVEAFRDKEFNRVLVTFRNTIINYFERRLTNASAESFNAKIKAFRLQFWGAT